MTFSRCSQAIASGEFSQWMSRIYKQHPNLAVAHGMRDSRHWGIALSGGVDSMALATLLSQHAQEQQAASSTPIRIHAMIVNHNLRDNSKEEAEYVSSLVQYLGIEPHVLHLDWEKDMEMAGQQARPHKAHLETQARVKRYNAIAHQCAKLSIRHLFVGHHAGDQVETVLFRLARASGIDGLAGIQNVSPMGVVNTAQAKSIQVIRPLLYATKDRLEATCRAAKTNWVEDPTNRSLDYQRNIIRHYQKDVDSLVDQQPALSALSTSSLMAFRERMDRHRRVAYAQVSPWLSRIEFDKENGQCFLQLCLTRDYGAPIPSPVPWLSPSQEHIGTRLLSQLVRWVTCKDHVPRSEDVLQLLHRLRQVENVLPSGGNTHNPVQRQTEQLQDDTASLPVSTVYRRLKPRHRKGASAQNTGNQPLSSINHAGVLISPPRLSNDTAATRYWTMSRQPYSVAERLAATVDVRLTSVNSKESTEILWNNRFFVGMQRLQLSDKASSLQIRLLQPADINALRTKMKKESITIPRMDQVGDRLADSEATLLKAYLDRVPNKARYLIPVVVDPSEQSIVSIPSIGIHLQPHRFFIQSQYRYSPPT